MKVTKVTVGSKRAHNINRYLYSTGRPRLFLGRAFLCKLQHLSPSQIQACVGCPVSVSLPSLARPRASASHQVVCSCLVLRRATHQWGTSLAILKYVLYFMKRGAQTRRDEPASHRVVRLDMYTSVCLVTPKLVKRSATWTSSHSVINKNHTS